METGDESLKCKSNPNQENIENQRKHPSGSHGSALGSKILHTAPLHGRTFTAPFTPIWFHGYVWVNNLYLVATYSHSARSAKSVRPIVVPYRLFVNTAQIWASADSFWTCRKAYTQEVYATKTQHKTSRPSKNVLNVKLNVSNYADFL